MPRLLIPLLLLSIPCVSQKIKAKKDQRAIVENLQKHVSFLADDRLEGRRAGTEGERLASEYISQEFKRIGITPMNQNGDYFQSFTIEEGKKVSEGARIIIDGMDTIQYPTGFQPFAFSPSVDRLRTDFNPEIKEKGHAWKLDFGELVEKNRDNPHFDAMAALRSEINLMADLGASAVIVTNSPKTSLDPIFNPKDRTETTKIPAFHIDENTYRERFERSSSDHNLQIDYRVVQANRKARNVVGWIDNKAATNVIIGAHFDHLGYGEDGNSMTKSAEKSIHNGADDNASGTACMIELARILKSSDRASHNYVFIAFSAEELGLYGSKHFVESPIFQPDRTSYMVNLDMVGRLNDSTRTITIGGFGTSSKWGQILREDFKEYGFRIRYDSSGTGPSDHTSFYRKDIPVLFFFTGLHGDYHKPSDDPEKINYTASMNIVRYIHEIVQKTNDFAKLDFQKTREQQTGTSTRFSVSMGIMPDYTYSGSGVRVDGVSEGRPAKTAGIRAGDIVIRMGEKNVDSVESYMRALSSFKKGDKTRVTVTRGNETISYDITF